MNIAIVNTCVPFLRGGAEYLADALVETLNEYGHPAILIRYPFSWHPPEKIIESMLACSMLKLPNVDRVIALKFPAYFVQHENKVLWLLHQFRQVYDLWGTAYQDVPDDTIGAQVRNAVIASDSAYLRAANKIYVNSEVTARRLLQYNSLTSEILYPPLLTKHHARAHEYGDFIFCPSRMTAGKRQSLLIEAMQYVRSDVRLVLAGSIESPYSEETLRRSIHERGVTNRVTILPGFLPEPDKLRFIETCLAGAYIPVDEDSYGYVTMEHFLGKKPVITTSDAGGIHILVKDSYTGLIVEPEPRELAAAMDRLYEDRNLARTLGENALALVNSMNITWDRVVSALTA